ncbi:isoflavone 2'-hydroxylase-like protein [Tanacetum coccineum]
MTSQEALEKGIQHRTRPPLFLASGNRGLPLLHRPVKVEATFPDWVRSFELSFALLPFVVTESLELLEVSLFRRISDSVHESGDSYAFRAPLTFPLSDLYLLFSGMLLPSDHFQDQEYLIPCALRAHPLCLPKSSRLLLLQLFQSFTARYTHNTAMNGQFLIVLSQNLRDTIQRMYRKTDHPNLHKIQCIINETYIKRLFPEAPLLEPKTSQTQDCTIGGFHVSCGTMVIVNAWAIHRDPMLWDDPLSFKPERFEKVENEGYWFIAFGMGRCQCPGSSLANRIVGLALTTFDPIIMERIGEDMVILRGRKRFNHAKI